MASTAKIALGVGCGIVGGFLLLVGGCFACFTASTVMIASKVAEADRAQQARTGNKSRSVGIGEEGRLRAAGSEKLMIARTPDAFDEAVHLAVLRDNLGLAKMAVEGRCFLVSQGTRVKLLEWTFTRSRVRVLEGPQLAEDGWVPNEFVVGD